MAPCGAACKAVLALTVLSSSCSAFYLPGVAPQDYARDDIVNFKVRQGACAQACGQPCVSCGVRLRRSPSRAAPSAGELAVFRKKRAAA